MRLVRAFLFFPIAFSVVMATGDGNMTETTPTAPSVSASTTSAETEVSTGPKAADNTSKAVDAAVVTFKQYLDFVMKLNEAVTLREEDTKKKLLFNFPLFGAAPFDGAWGDLKDVLRKVTELRALLLKGHTFGLPVTTPQEKQQQDVGKAAVALFDFFMGAATDAVTVADKAARAVTGMDPDKAFGFHVTPATADALFEFLPDLYEKLKDLHKKVGEWVEITSTFDDTKMVTHAGDHRPKQWLRQGGFTDDEVKGDTALGDLKKKLEELVGPANACEKVLCTLASYALMRAPQDPVGKHAWLLLLSQAMENDAMKKKVKDGVDAVTGKGGTFVEELKNLNKLAPLPKEQVPKQYRFPGVYANLDVHHFWTVLTGVFGTIHEDLDKVAKPPKAGSVVTQGMAELVKAEGTLGKLAAQLKEGETDKAAASTQEAAAAAVQATPGLRKEGQGEDGAQFTGVGMAMFCVSVAVAVF
nr:GPI-anchored protein 52 [Babesia gibsoni]